MNIENVKKAVRLQLAANQQIDTMGQADSDLMEELLELVDGFNSDEEDLFINIHNKIVNGIQIKL